MPVNFSATRRLPRLGKIRLGIKNTAASGAQYPKAVDYFVVNPDGSTPEAAVKAFREVYGEKPRVLDIMFPVEDKDIFFPQWHCRYGKGTGLICKGDGNIAHEVDLETGELRKIACDPFECQWAAKKHCRPVGRLQILLYKINGLGTWQIDTSSYHSIVNLNSAIDFVRSLTGGRISMIPLQLVLRPREVQVNGRKKIVYVLDLASENINLAQILEASRQTPQQLLVPEVDLNELPDDLYPAALQESTQPPESESAPKPVLKTEPEPASAPPAEDEGEVFNPFEDEDDFFELPEDNMDAAIQQAFDKIGVSEGKRKALLSRCTNDKHKELLLQKLNQQIAKMEQPVPPAPPLSGEAREETPEIGQPLF